MHQYVGPIIHADWQKKADTELEAEAHERFKSSPVFQFMSELLMLLRENNLTWWKPEFLWRQFPTSTRMVALTQRPDIRQRTTNLLTKLDEKTARNLGPEEQAKIIEAALASGAIDHNQHEQAFATFDLALYMDLKAFWNLFMERMPFEDSSPENQELISKIMERMLTLRGSWGGKPLGSVISAHNIRMALRPLWNRRIPLHIREAIDDARLKRESQGREIFRASDELAIATPEIITAHINLRDLLPIFRFAEQAMGFKSYDALPAAKTEIKLLGPAIKVVEHELPPEDGWKPRESRTTIEVEEADIIPATEEKKEAPKDKPKTPPPLPRRKEPPPLPQQKVPRPNGSSQVH